MIDLRKQVGQRIKNAREGRVLTQKELGQKLGVGRVTINGYEAGEQNLTLDTLQKIAEALGIEPKELLE